MRGSALCNGRRRSTQVGRHGKVAWGRGTVEGYRHLGRSSMYYSVREGFGAMIPFVFFVALQDEIQSGW